MHDHQQTPKKTSAKPPKFEVKTEAGRGAPIALEPRLSTKSGCSCGRGCPRCKAKANALSALRRKGESQHQESAAGMRISNPGDAHERQAEQVADRVMRASGAHASGLASGPDDGAVQVDRVAEAKGDVRADLAGAPSGVRQALATPGRPLDEATRSFMEQRFGFGFGHVRVYDGGNAHRSAVALGARAGAWRPRACSPSIGSRMRRCGSAGEIA